MADRIDNLTERVQIIDDNVGHLAERFNAVDAAFVEQRQYPEFAYLRLIEQVDAGHARLDAKMDAGFVRVERIERKLDRLVNQRLPRARKPRR